MIKMNSDANDKENCRNTRRYLRKRLRQNFDGDLDLSTAAKCMSSDVLGHHERAPVFGPKSFIRMEQTVPAIFESEMATQDRDRVMKKVERIR